MVPTLLTTTVYLTDAATVDEVRYAVPPWSGGEWKIKAAYWVPDTSVSTHAANYRTLTLKNGATSLKAITTNSSGGAAWTAGTPISMLPSGPGTAGEFTGGTDALTIDSTHASSGAAANGAMQITWERVS